MELNERMQIEADIIKVLKTVYDPEIPVNIYELGLIYEIKVNDDRTVNLKMTLTAPNCPVADQLVMEVQEQSASVNGVEKAEVELVFDPPWDQDMMTEEAKLELGLL